MFVDATTAVRIDRVEARLSLACAGPIADSLAIPLEGGAAVFARPGSPINKIIGAGFTGPLDPDALADIEARWRARGEPVRVELASLAAPAAADQLGQRGYRLLGFEHVLVRPLADADADLAPAHDIRQGHPAWRSVLVDGFAAPDGTGATVDSFGRDAIEAVMTDFTSAPGFTGYVALDAGQPAGAATLRVDDRVALLCGATTLPAARRRGVQAALLAARLRDARRAGCDLAVVTTAPGSLSQHNAARQGFVLAYVRAILVLPA